MNKLHIDIETYSSEPLDSAGVYRYAESVDFEILLLAYAFNYGEVKIVDLAAGEAIPYELSRALNSPQWLKYAHNAAFERTCLSKYGFDIPIEQWRCSAVKAAYCGLPRSLGEVSEVLDFGESAKDPVGKALIRLFCAPVKPVKANEFRKRNMYFHYPEKWEQFKMYCKKDVVAEREVDSRLLAYNLPEFEDQLYILDQEVNDRGVCVDMQLVRNAISIDSANAADLLDELRGITATENPGSVAQLKAWLAQRVGDIASLNKESLADLIKNSDDPVVSRVLELRQMTSKSAIKKYAAIQNCVAQDERIHGLFMHYGASRTGRWSGRLVQLHNLVRNSMDDLDLARKLVREYDVDMLNFTFDDTSSVLAQLIRTTLVAPEGKILTVADFSAIEARVIAWLAGEQWRLEVFNTHGKIYEASASMMFNTPLEQITKGSELRQKGKIAELALGYQGGVGALKTMGGEKMGLSEAEMKTIVTRWRAANPNIVALWTALDTTAKKACQYKRQEFITHGIKFLHDTYALKVTLPSGRELFYKNADIGEGNFGTVIKYEGVNQETKKWGILETYGGKIAENLIQAISRDILGYAMLNLKQAGFEIAMHVHDEAVAETDPGKEHLERMREIMGRDVPWAPGLPLRADGYQTEYYKKD